MAAVIVMLASGGAVALFVMIAAAIARKAAEREGHAQPVVSPERDRIAASILFQIVTLGGCGDDVALRSVRREAGIAAPITGGVDIANWAENYARITNEQQRARLLETAVQLVAARGVLVPLRQYVALLDLSFALGFQTDALAKLREQYGFDYIDHAKDGRPREADHAGRVTFFERDSRELLLVLGIEGEASRQSIVSAYRKLAAQHHPDRFHGQPASSQTEAAARFIEITRAYETLLSIYRE